MKKEQPAIYRFITQLIIEKFKYLRFICEYMECNDCGSSFKRLTMHWAKSNCNYPSFTEKQHQIIKGVLMGDGTVCDKFDDKRNPRFVVSMTSKNYLHYLFNIFGKLATSPPRVHRTDEQIANQYNEFSQSSDPDDFSTQYKIQTISHPELCQYEDWYSSGKKVFPEEIQLTPTLLKHWYVCDGSFNNNGSRKYLSIHLSNERENKDKIESYFENIGITIDRWRDDKQNNGRYKTSIIFNKDKTEELLEYMGDPLPDFRYKWP